MRAFLVNCHWTSSRLFNGPVLAVILTVSLAGCGPVLAWEMEGTWDGEWTLVLSGSPPQTYAHGTITVHILDPRNTASVSEICPDGSGSITVTGTEDAAAWSGTMACRPITVGSCTTFVLTFTQATLTFDPDFFLILYGLTFDARGVQSACDTSGNFDLHFEGSRPYPN